MARRRKKKAGASGPSTPIFKKSKKPKPPKSKKTQLTPEERELLAKHAKAQSVNQRRLVAEPQRVVREEREEKIKRDASSRSRSKKSNDTSVGQRLDDGQDEAGHLPDLAPMSGQCSAYTRAGKRCSNNAGHENGGMPLCYQHFMSWDESKGTGKVNLHAGVAERKRVKILLSQAANQGQLKYLGGRDIARYLNRIMAKIDCASPIVSKGRNPKEVAQKLAALKRATSTLLPRNGEGRTVKVKRKLAANRHGEDIQRHLLSMDSGG